MIDYEANANYQGEKVIAFMKENKLNKIFDKNLLIITLVYLLTQGMLLIINGWWWDDWTLFGVSQDALKEASLELGRPSVYFFVSLGKMFPDNAYRIVTFFLFYLTALFYYGILVRVTSFPPQNAAIITLLYIAIPANDARALSGIMPYTVGYFFFMAGFYILTRYLVNDKKKSWKNVLTRIIDIIFFFISFILNANLVLYSIPLIFIVYSKIKDGKARNLYKYIDFVAIPIVYFVLKNVLFSPYGIYEEYNEITMRGLSIAAIKIIPVVFYLLEAMLYFWMDHISVAIIITLLTFLIFNVKNGISAVKRLIDEKSIQLICSDERGYSITTSVAVGVIGIIILCIGVFPYEVVREGYKLSLTGVSGRDSVLVPLGAAIVFFSIVELCVRERIKNFVYLLLIVCGICHFNYYYLSYQQDYYRQMDLIYELKENSELLSDKKNIIYITDYEPIVATTRFYSLNGNAKEAFGDESHFVMDGFQDLKYLNNTEKLSYFVNSGSYNMSDYDLNNKKDIDCIISYVDGPSLCDTLKLKFLELTNEEKFEEKLYASYNLKIYISGSEEYDQIYNKNLGEAN